MTLFHCLLTALIFEAAFIISSVQKYRYHEILSLYEPEQIVRHELRAVMVNALLWSILLRILLVFLPRVLCKFFKENRLSFDIISDSIDIDLFQKSTLDI